MNKDIVSTIKLRGTERLSTDNLSVLTLLYQPLIEANGIMQYITFYELLNKSDLTYEGVVKEVLDILHTDIKTFMDTLHKLEGIALVNTYYSNEQGYYIDLLHPLDANEFLKDGSLGVYLYAEIGESLFKKIQKQFQVSGYAPSGYDNITKSFDEVFKPQSGQVSVTGNHRQKKSSLLTFHSEFDFADFTTHLHFQTENDLSDKLKDTVLKLAYTYDLSPKQMANVYHRSLNAKGIIDYRSFPKEARKEYGYHNESSVPKIEFKLPDTKEEGLLSHFKQVSPKQLLKELSGMEPPSTELDTVYKLYHLNHMDPSVINLLLFYVLKINQGKMPSYTYFSKIANEWGRRKLSTVEEVYAYLLKQQKSSKARTDLTTSIEQNKATPNKEVVTEQPKLDINVVQDLFNAL